MRRKSLIILGLVAALVTLQSCSSKPEQSLLTSYFHAVSLNDVSTMSTMAVDPLKIDAESWSITKVSEEKIEPAVLAEMGTKEADLKKQYDASSGPALDAQDTLNSAKDEFNSARTAAAKAAAKAKVDAAQKKFDEAYQNNRNLLNQYNEAKAAAAKEEEITSFSLGYQGSSQLPNIRDLKGNVHSKDLEVQVKGKDGAAKNYKIAIKMYDLKDEAANIARRGRWVITKFEQL
jgi:hypothetical protein